MKTADKFTIEEIKRAAENAKLEEIDWLSLEQELQKFSLEKAKAAACPECENGVMQTGSQTYEDETLYFRVCDLCGFKEE